MITAEGPLDFVQQHFSLVALVGELACGCRALRPYRLYERSICESELPCRLVALAGSLIGSLPEKDVPEFSRLLLGRDSTMLMRCDGGIGVR